MILRPTSWMVSWKRYSITFKRSVISAEFFLEIQLNNSETILQIYAWNSKRLECELYRWRKRQKYGNKFVLRVQLIVANNEKHLWGKSYDREIRETSDIISIQSEIAQSIAAELKTIITPKEKQLINKIPTTNLTAYDFYQQEEKKRQNIGLMETRLRCKKLKNSIIKHWNMILRSLWHIQVWQGYIGTSII